MSEKLSDKPEFKIGDPVKLEGVITERLRLPDGAWSYEVEVGTFRFWHFQGELRRREVSLWG